MRRMVAPIALMLLGVFGCCSSIVADDVRSSGRIDELLAERWRSESVEPSSICDDEAFVRRLYLDLIGRIPTLLERSEFLADAAIDKRERLVDRLLASPAYGENMRDVFDVVFMGRGDEGRGDGGRGRGRRGGRTIEKRQRNGWHDYLAAAFDRNRPWDEVCREIVLARPTSEENRAAAWFLFERENRFQEIAEAVSPAIFGVQIQCAQCHDHPLTADIEQRHYWGLVAFFNRGQNVMAAGGPQVAESAVGGWNKFADLSGASSDAALAFIGAKAIDEPRPADGEKEDNSADRYRESTGEDKDRGAPRVPVFSRRERFADDVLKDHPLVARAMANRMWGLLMGRGISHPVDKLDFESDPSHPALLDDLADEFRDSGYDVKQLVRRIATSRAYRLSDVPTGDGIDPALFAHAIERPLIAEAYYRSMRVALSQDPNTQADDELLAAFCETFPDVLAEQSVANLKQTLFLTNHEGMQRMFIESSAATELASRATSEGAELVVEELFLRCLGRSPTDEERGASVALIHARADDPQVALADIAWALCTGAEFRWNH